MRYLADFLVELMNFLAYHDSGGANIVEFMEIWVVFIEDRPKLQVDESCLFKFAENLLLQILDFYFRKQIQELFLRLYADFLVHLVLHPGELVVLVEG